MLAQHKSSVIDSWSCEEYRCKKATFPLCSSFFVENNREEILNNNENTTELHEASELDE